MNALDFDTAVTPHLSELRAYAFALTRNHVDADDVVQDTIERAMRYWHLFTPAPSINPRAAGSAGSVHGWLRLMMYRLVCSRYKRTQVDKRLAGEAEPGVGDLRDDVATLDTKAGLAAALGAISPLRRDIVDRVLGRGESYQAVADALGLPIGTVMSNLHRARRALKDALGVFGSAPDSPGIDLVGFETAEGVQADADGVDRVVAHRHEGALVC